MLTHAPKIPGWIAAEIEYLSVLTEIMDLERLRERREHQYGVKVDIYHHSAGTDSYFCDVRKRYFRWKDVIKQADAKVTRGQYLFTAVLEYEKGVHFVSSMTDPNPQLN